MSARSPCITLNSSVELPALGLGVFQSPPAETVTLTPDQVAAIDALDTAARGGPEPETITLENYGRPIPEA